MDEVKHTKILNHYKNNRKMNTFQNLQQELVLPLNFGATRCYQARVEKHRQLSIMLGMGLHKRINKRGADEQYKSRFLPNYVGVKRLAKSCGNYFIHI